MDEQFKLISALGIVPTFEMDDSRKAVPLARAMAAGGLPIAEVSFRTAAAAESIRRISSECPEVLVGAGDVLTCEQVDQALEAGGMFISTPGFAPEVIRYARSKGALVIPCISTAEEAEQYGYEVIRYMMVQAHYRSPINYCKELLDACKASLERLYACRDTLDRAIAAAKSGEVAPEAAETFAKRKEQFITAMDDDLNTADGMTAIFELVRDLNRMSADAATSKEQLEAGAKLFDELIGVMGLLYNRKKTDEIPAEVTELVEQRKAARKAKDFAEADRLRDAIAALGYAVRETRQGTEITKI